MEKGRSGKRNAKNVRGPLSKSRASYFRFARFKNFPTILSESLAEAKASDVNNHIAEHQLQGRRTIKSTGTLRYALRILQTTIDDSP